MKELTQGGQLQTTLAQHFYVPKLFSIRRQYVKGALCVPETILDKGQDINICSCLSAPSEDGWKPSPLGLRKHKMLPGAY
jgi:hypothetical protein